MTPAFNLLHQHIQTFVDDNAHWQTLIADNLLWELPYAPSLGHPPRLLGRKEVVNHVTWFLSSIENFRFRETITPPLSGNPCSRSFFTAVTILPPAFKPPARADTLGSL